MKSTEDGRCSLEILQSRDAKTLACFRNNLLHFQVPRSQQPQLLNSHPFSCPATSFYAAHSSPLPNSHISRFEESTHPQPALT